MALLIRLALALAGASVIAAAVVVRVPCGALARTAKSLVIPAHEVVLIRDEETAVACLGVAGCPQILAAACACFPRLGISSPLVEVSLRVVDSAPYWKYYLLVYELW